MIQSRKLFAGMPNCLSFSLSKPDVSQLTTEISHERDRWGGGEREREKERDRRKERERGREIMARKGGHDKRGALKTFNTFSNLSKFLYIDTFRVSIATSSQLL